MILTGCQGPEVQETPMVEEVTENELNIFLANSSNDELVELCVEVDKTSINSQITDIVTILSQGSDEEDLYPTIPGDDLIDSLEVNGSGVKINVNRSFEQMNQVEMLLCRVSLIKSLTAIEGIDYVEFYVDGLPMKNGEGIVYGPFYEQDVITVTGDAYGHEIVDVILYYPDSQGEYLVPIPHQITINNDEDLELKMLQALAIVPEGYDVYVPYPDGTTIKSININNGVAYIDFNEEFKSNHYGGSTGELMTIYSIVNTLTERRNISRVQFLIEGVKTVDFKGHVDFSELFEYNIALIESE